MLSCPLYTPLGLPNFSVSRPLKAWLSGFLSARVGDWIYLVALNWTIMLRTESAWLLALINAYRLAPTLFLSVPSGMLADRFDRRRLLQALYVSVSVLTLAVGWALVTDQPFWLLAVLVVARACIMTMDPPIRNAFMADLAEGEDFSRAVAWNASTMNLGRTVGPLLAGVLLARFEPSLSFLIATLAVAAVPWTLSRLPATGRKDRKKKVKAPLSEAVSYLRRDPQAGYLLLLAVPAMLFGFPYVSMLPLITKDLLGLGSEGFGTLLAISALGSFAATTWLGSQPKRLCHGRFLVASLLGFSGGLTLLVVAPHYTVAAGIAFPGRFYCPVLPHQWTDVCCSQKFPVTCRAAWSVWL